MASSSRIDHQYTCKLKLRIQDKFQYYVKPFNVLTLFHKYNNKVLVVKDRDIVTATINAHGDMEGALKLLDLLSIYDGWFETLLKVLRDPMVNLDHVADQFEKDKAELDNNLEQDIKSHEEALRKLKENHKKEIEKLKEHYQTEIRTLKEKVHDTTQQDLQLEVRAENGIPEIDDRMADPISQKQQMRPTEAVRADLDNLDKVIEDYQVKISQLQESLGQKDEVICERNKAIDILNEVMQQKSKDYEDKIKQLEDKNSQEKMLHYPSAMFRKSDSSTVLGWVPILHTGSLDRDEEENEKFM